ncbi:cytochrome c oxidase assembly factor 3 homolog, mitochondrial [Opisthocomus hoazin]|uniref:cytochrome c oxidase assembly factor 3 homolog, mitochondrial n=1 Tax=Opisthocomus hoazin TaxID=30419 RepID=UPI003F53D661
MAAPREPGGEAAFARRIDPAREPGLSPEQRLLMAQVERAQRHRALQRRLRGRNALLALGIGAVALGIYGYTFYSVSQEGFLDELEQEVEAARARAQERAGSAAS